LEVALLLFSSVSGWTVEGGFFFTSSKKKAAGVHSIKFTGRKC
jgi:hypothetical protein